MKRDVVEAKSFIQLQYSQMEIINSLEALVRTLREQVHSVETLSNKNLNELNTFRNLHSMREQVIENFENFISN